MATRKQRIDFATKRFKGFWNQFRKSKRGLVGFGIILVFSLVAIFAPVVAPYKAIDPQLYVGDYQFTYPKGLIIASPLAKPAWYRYLPWIPRGDVNVTEIFYSTLIVTPLGVGGRNITTQMFTPVEALNMSLNSNLLLSRRVGEVRSIDVEFENGTEAEMPASQWGFAQVGSAQFPRTNMREIKVSSTYPNNTRVSVNYRTGVDLVDNVKVVTDHMFATPQSLDEWDVQVNGSAALISVSHNAEKGMSLGAYSKPERGCLEISYNGITAPTENITITLTKSFSYAYNEPPKDFGIYSSIMLEPRSDADVSQWNSATLEMWLSRADGTAEYRIARAEKASNVTKQAKYIPDQWKSTEQSVANNVQASPPQDRLFSAGGEYEFSVRIIISRGSQVSKIYLDSVDFLIYGNTHGLLGSDNGVPFPRDIFSLLVWGSRVSLFVGVLSAIFSTLIGLFLGLVSGYVGGLIDEGIMRFADLLLVLPTLPLFIVLVVALKAVAGTVSMWNIIIVLTLFGWMGFARSVRSMVLSIRERAFIEAAKAAGAGRLHIINKHIVPNVFALVYITLATAVPGAIITEASLSWLGLGDPMMASWGKILYDFNSSSVAVSLGLTEYWFWIFPACVSIAVLATAFILVGYALDEILNPRLRERR